MLGDTRATCGGHQSARALQAHLGHAIHCASAGSVQRLLERLAEHEGLAAAIELHPANSPQFDPSCFHRMKATLGPVYFKRRFV
jgi:hypothetical protein